MTALPLGKCAFWVFFGCFGTVGSCQGTAGEDCGYIFFVVVASSLLACSFPFSPLLLQHSLRVTLAFVGLCGRIRLHVQRSLYCTMSEWKALLLTNLLCMNETLPLQGGMHEPILWGQPKVTDSLKFNQCIHRASKTSTVLCL